MSNVILDMETAYAVVEFESNDGSIVYSEYIEANGVTVENVGKHVAALAALTFPTGNKGLTAERKMDRKYLMNRYRNGLNYQLGNTSKKGGGSSDKFVTAAGLKAESWEAFVEKARAEWEAANNK